MGYYTRKNMKINPTRLVWAAVMALFVHCEMVNGSDEEWKPKTMQEHKRRFDSWKNIFLPRGINEFNHACHKSECDLCKKANKKVVSMIDGEIEFNTELIRKIDQKQTPNKWKWSNFRANRVRETKNLQDTRKHYL